MLKIFIRQRPFKVMVLLEVLSLVEAPSQSPRAMFKGERSLVQLARDKGERGEGDIFCNESEDRYACTHMHVTCASCVYLVLTEARKKHQIPLNWRYCCELPCGCWKLNPGPLQEQPVEFYKKI